MIEENNPKLTVRIEKPYLFGSEHRTYVNLRELRICGRLTERNLWEHMNGTAVVFEREDVALEGRLYFRNKSGDYRDHSNAKIGRDKYVVKPINGHDIKCPWNKVNSGLGVRNPIHDNLEIYLKSGDRLTFLGGEKHLKRYEIALTEN